MKQSRPYPVYTITPKGERAILSGHPWVYAEELTDQPDPAPANGALVDVVSAKGRYLGTGLLSQHSKIRYGFSAATPTTALTRTSGAAVWNTPGPTAKR